MTRAQQLDHIAAAAQNIRETAHQLGQMDLLDSAAQASAHQRIINLTTVILNRVTSIRETL